MRTVRRCVIVITWTLVSAQALGVALEAAQLCRDREHTHGGAAAPECLMHHQTQAQSGASQDHAHHAGARPSDVDGAGGQRMSCRCGGDVTALSSGPVGILQVAPSYSPFFRALMLDAVGEPSVADPWFSPPSPPPR